jgi:hypothetical protein
LASQLSGARPSALARRNAIFWADGAPAGQNAIERGRRYTESGRKLATTQIVRLQVDLGNELARMRRIVRWPASLCERAVQAARFFTTAITVDSLSKNLRHGFAFGEFIDKLVQLANPLHQRILDFFHADAADHPFDERTVWIHRWRLSKEGFKVIPPFDLMQQTSLVVASKPADDTVNLFLRAPLALGFLDIHWIHAAKGVAKIRCPGIFVSLDV